MPYITDTNKYYLNLASTIIQSAPHYPYGISIPVSDDNDITNIKGTIFKIESSTKCVGHIPLKSLPNDIIRISTFIKPYCDKAENKSEVICRGLSSTGSETPVGTTQSNTFNRDEYIRKTDIQRIADIASDQCPVESAYDPDDYVRKTEINMRACKAQPDLKDYVLKSTIPPIQKCPSCICPKVKVSAGMCKKCPEPKNNCPKPAPCDVAQCKNVVKCEPYYKQVSCPKCPAPQACPEPPKRLCPALTIDKPNIKCPAPKPCAMPTPCHDGKGRCPEKKSAKCSFKGIDTVIKDKSVEEIVEKLLNSEDPKLTELLEKLKNKLNVNETDSPAQLNVLRNEISNLRSMLTSTENENGNENGNGNEVGSNNNVEPAPTSSSSTLMELDDTYLSVNKDFVHVNTNNDCANGNCPYNTNLNI